MFYEDMIERFKTLDNWNEDILPMTESKKTKIIEALPQIYKYLKEHYIVPRKDLNMRTDLFLSEYRLVSKDKTSNQKLGRYLTKIGIVGVKNSKNQGYNYKMTADEMLKCFQANEWIDEKIDFINPDDPNDVNNSEFCFEEEKVKLVSNHQIEVRELKRQIDELRGQLHRKQTIRKSEVKETVIEVEELKDMKGDEEIESLEDLKALENTIRKKKNKSTKKVIERPEDDKLCQHLAELEKELFDDLI
jgi:hypothetical protein